MSKQYFISYAVVDMQGIFIPEFFPKELTIKVDNNIQHFMLKTPTPWRCLSEDDKKQNIYVEKNIHGIRYSHHNDGTVDYYHVEKKLKELQVDVVFVKGHQKYKFLENILDLKIINLEKFPDSPNLSDVNNFNYCSYHCNTKYNCAYNNVELLDYYVNGYLL